MNEAEWDHCQNPGLLIEQIGGRATARKVRLFNAASVKLLCGPTTNQIVRSLLAVAEKMADGAASRAEIVQARLAARRIRREFPPAPKDEPIWNCVEAVAPDPFPSFQGIQVCTTCFVSPSPGPEWSAALWRDAPTWVFLLRELFGNPFRPVVVDPSWLSWNDSTIPKIAQAIYDERAFDRLLILADALEEAGCNNADILTHLRGNGPHVRGCWPVDLILGKS
ncbi:MAG TPA: hypothetical protein VH682_03975 [Gemmataceae bacterium]|jgi:hypothetical protein